MNSAIKKIGVGAWKRVYMRVQWRVDLQVKHRIWNQVEAGREGRVRNQVRLPITKRVRVHHD